MASHSPFRYTKALKLNFGIYDTIAALIIGYRFVLYCNWATAEAEFNNDDDDDDYGGYY